MGFLILITLLGYGIEILIFGFSSLPIFHAWITLGIIVVFVLLLFFFSELQDKLAKHYLKNAQDLLEKYEHKKYED